MFEKNQLFVSCVLYCLIQFFTVTYGFELNHLRTKTFNHRIKRDGGIIAFRPLFVYRQQQKEKQAAWKLKESQKLQHQLQLHIHQNSIDDYYSKYPVNVGKVDYSYRPAYTSYPRYQTTSPYQTTINDYSTIKPYQNYQNYPQYSNDVNPIYSSSYLVNGRFYSNQQGPLFDKYDSANYQ